MKIATLGLLAALTAGVAGSAMAGPNANGYLLLHTDDTVVYSEDDEGTYCDFLTVECPFDPECDDNHDGCASAAMSLNPTSGRGSETTMIWVVAAFQPDACPRVAAIQFGMSWPPEYPASPMLAWGNCGDFEIATDGWPTDLSSGTAVTWGNAITRTAFPVYWFAAYAYYGAIEITIDDFTNGPAAFADDHVPSVIDPVPNQNWGVLGMAGATGSNPYIANTPVHEKSWGEVKAIFGR
ncbi:MAG: hypothetical protein R3E97_17510 [Candidatus Eisenbacteria bacterium]